MDDGLVRRAQMVGLHHFAQRVLEGALRIGKKRRDTGECLYFLGVKDVEDHANEERMAGLFPMIRLSERAFRIDQNVGNILDVADFVRPFAHFQERVVTCRPRVGRIEQQAMRELGRASRPSVASFRP